MPTIVPPSKVLVTGANGFLAAWIIQTLLKRGYSVRGVVRSEARSKYLCDRFRAEVENGSLEFTIVSNMTIAGAFDDAAKGVHAIVHTATPVSLGADDPNELIEPAVKGTLGVLESAMNHAGDQLKRIIVTSSCASVVNTPYAGIYDESSWNEGAITEVMEKGKSASQLGKYRASKVLAEKAAWDFVSRNHASIKWDLTTICCPYIFGPVLLDPLAKPTELTTSMSFFYKAIFCKLAVNGDMGSMQGEWIDVRDLAEGHARALEIPEAGGERFILSSGLWIWQDWLDAGNQLSIPNVDLPLGNPGEGKQFSFRVRFDTTKARTTLGVQCRGMSETARDIIEDFASRGWTRGNQ